MDDHHDDVAGSSSFYNLGNHDVFLSFRGPDTRRIFAGHLFDALERKSIFTFLDSEKLEKGEALSVLLEAIKMSKLSIVVFSTNYAFSTWCLKELAQIMECMDTKKQIVVPVFYGVEPAEISHQTGSFKQAFDKHEQDARESPEVLQRWRSALTKAATLHGWDSRKYEDDNKLIKAITEDIVRKMKHASTSISGWKYDVFVNFRAQDTGRNFVSHLYAALRRKSVSTFPDRKSTGTIRKSRGTILTAIEESMISVVILSRDYASSTSCLDELHAIMECRGKKNHIVMPIFYQVDPSEVRHQKGIFKLAIDKHEQHARESPEVLQRWRSALTQASMLSGWDSFGHRDDAAFIEDIALYIHEKLMEARSKMYQGDVSKFGV